MEEINQSIVTILQKSVNGIPLDKEETRELEEWLEQSSHNREVFEEVMNPEKLEQEIKAILAYDSKILWKKISRKISPARNNWRYAAAVLLILISLGSYFIFFPKNLEKPSAENQRHAPIPELTPGLEKAILTLSTGRQIVLDSASHGVIAEEDNARLINIGGKLSYQTLGKGSEQLFNTVTTSPGGQYKLSLPDGSRVWLNAASSIRYPVNLGEGLREVSISGEVYFEVARRPGQRFRVWVNGMEIEVLGTHFNVNAYDDESSINTTLLEGALKIKKNGKIAFLKPGEQIQADRKGNLKLVNSVNLGMSTAWKDGFFEFDNTDLKMIMRQVSRWYNVDIKYEKEISGTFSGKIQRSVNASSLFSYLQLTKHVRFRIEGKKVIVTD